MIKALFFDIDGTLVSFATHRILVSTVRALRQVRQNGFKIFIATGRPRQLINNIDEISDLIDGYVTVNGAYCFVGDEVVDFNPISACEAYAIWQAADRMGAACLSVGVGGLRMDNASEELLCSLRQLFNVGDIRGVVSFGELARQGIVQMTVFVTEEQEPELLAGAPTAISSRWYPTFTDVTSDGADKGRGIARMAEYFGIRIEETMAFGDGGNDVAMLRAAGIGVAMGNAGADVQSVADYVTDSVDCDGVEKALSHFGLI